MRSTPLRKHRLPLPPVEDTPSGAVKIEKVTPLAPSTRPNPYYFRRALPEDALPGSETTLLMWTVLARDPENPERFGEPDNDPDGSVPLYGVGGVLVTIGDPTVESFISGHPELTQAEAAEIASQAEVVIREAALEHDRIVDV